jgi:putative transposase
MHALWTLPPGDEDFSHRWRVIKRMVTQRCQTRLNQPLMNARRRKRNQSILWQHRFWEHLIRDEAEFDRHIDYIDWNPVKHGYVAEVTMAVFELPSVCQTGVAASKLGKQHRITQRR